MVCSRFAPSPTGDLHVGSARTALYAWLYAKRHQGRFILRIEDTDRERSTTQAVQVILDGMTWLGLDYEGPYYQTNHFARYREVADLLLASQHAYKCYCSKDRLEMLRTEQMANKEKPRYDGHCRRLEATSTQEDPQKPYVIRFKNPVSGCVVFDDHIRGRIEIQNSELDDLILIRSDGNPTYNFTVVVDDMDMGVTMVIRGEDHINNTPRQLNLFQALGKTSPNYAHVPMILGSDGKKLSKRHGAVSVLQYQIDGYLPQAVLNYLVRLGWAQGDKEIFSITEMQEAFSVDAIHKSAAQFNIEKLKWLNQHYLKHLPVEDVIPHLQWHFERLGLDVNQGPALAKLIPIQADRCKTLVEMVDKSRYFYENDFDYDQEAMRKHYRPELLPALSAVQAKLTVLSDWQRESIHVVLNQVAVEYTLNFAKLAQPIRIAVTGSTMSPSLDLTLLLLGKQQTLKRLIGFILKANEF